MDIPIEIKLDFKSMKKDLIHGIYNCSQRGLYHAVKWLSEINLSLKHVTLPSESRPEKENDLEEEFDEFILAKSYFDLKEYDRCSHFVKKCIKPKCKFLYFYSKYLSIEKKKLEDNMIDTNSSHDSTKNEALIDLCTTLKIENFENKLDGYSLYLYGVVLKKLDLIPIATEIFIKAVNAEPILWSAWFELGKIIPDRHTIFATGLPDHWMKYFFLAHTYLEQLNNDESLQMYNTFYSLGFENCTYVLSQIALGHHNRRSK